MRSEPSLRQGALLAWLGTLGRQLAVLAVCGGRVRSSTSISDGCYDLDHLRSATPEVANFCLCRAVFGCVAESTAEGTPLYRQALELRQHGLCGILEVGFSLILGRGLDALF